MDRRSRTHLSATAAAAAPRPVNSCTAMSPEIFYPSSWATVWRTDRSGPRTFRTTLYVCVCCWLVPVLVGSASLQPRGRDADLVPAHWMCVCVLVSCCCCSYCSSWWWWLDGFFFVLWVEGDQAVVLLLILACSCRRRLRRPKNRKTSSLLYCWCYATFSRPSQTHSRPHQQHTHTGSHSHSLTHTQTVGVCSCVWFFSLCVGFYLISSSFFSGYFMILSITLFFFFSLFLSLVIYSLAFLSASWYLTISTCFTSLYNFLLFALTI